MDEGFTPKQREIIIKALQGLADHPRFAEKMAELQAKGADINIVPDFRGDMTNGLAARTSGMNSDGTVDPGESITIYINMNPNSAPVSDFGFAIAIVHELIHTLGDPSLHAELDAYGSELDRSVTKEIFSGYNFYAAAAGVSQDVGILDLPSSGGSLSGLASYEIFSGSDASDIITPGNGGSLVYSGDGNDQIVLSLDGVADEIIDSGGNDSIVLPSGTVLSAVSTRWSADGQSLAVMVDGRREAIVINAAAGGSVEEIAIDGIGYAIGLFTSAQNVVPDDSGVSVTYYDAFFGGWIADGSVSDANGDLLTYRLGSVTGEFADRDWVVDGATGNISGNFTRYAEPGTKYSFVTLIASDGVDASTFTVTVHWGNSGEYETPMLRSHQRRDETPFNDSNISAVPDWTSLSDTPLMYA